jgi:hypothetical protein
MYPEKALFPILSADATALVLDAGNGFTWVLRREEEPVAEE